MFGRIAILACVCAALVSCGQRPTATATSSVSTEYDHVSDQTTVILTVALDAEGHGSALTYVFADGDYRNGLSADDRRDQFDVLTGFAEGCDLFVLADGARYECRLNDKGEVVVGLEAMRAMANGKSVEVSVGGINGPLPTESQRAIAEYLALFE